MREPCKFCGDICRGIQYHYTVSIEEQPLGWRCPNCGKGIAPHISECSCVREEVMRPPMNIEQLRENTDDLIELSLLAQKISRSPPMPQE